jgi:hypothetical protein
VASRLRLYFWGLVKEEGFPEFFELNAAEV